MTTEEYLSFEATSQIKQEFVDGYIYAMADEHENHNLIRSNVLAHVWLAAKGKNCLPFFSEIKFRIGSEIYYYPDIFLACGESERGVDIKSQACFILEVLSESTSDIDRGEKLRNYRKAPALQAYILVSQAQKLVEVYRPLGDGSWRHEILEEGFVHLPCLDLNLSFNDIYEDVTLDRPEK